MQISNPYVGCWWTLRNKQSGLWSLKDKSGFFSRNLMLFERYLMTRISTYWLCIQVKNKRNSRTGWKLLSTLNYSFVVLKFFRKFQYSQPIDMQNKCKVNSVKPMLRTFSTTCLLLCAFGIPSENMLIR